MESDLIDVDSGAEAVHPAVRRVDKLGELLDDWIRVPGTDFQIGLDPILGVLPGAGDAVATGLSLYIVLEAFYADVPRSTLARMLSYVAIDAAFSSVPILGTVFDLFWKANERNARLLAEHAEGGAEQ